MKFCASTELMSPSPVAPQECHFDLSFKATGSMLATECKGERGKGMLYHSTMALAFSNNQHRSFKCYGGAILPLLIHTYTRILYRFVLHFIHFHMKPQFSMHVLR